MAKFINTKKAVSELEDIIRNAGERLILVSPYLRLSKDFRELLSYRNGKDKITTIIFGKQELRPDELNFLQSLRFVNLKYNESLHAKCYMNENKMIITSLNLYEFSMANNKEMGVLIDRSDPNDVQLFDDGFKEINYIIDTSQKFESNAINQKPSKVTESFTPDTRRSITVKRQSGFCIRTGLEIPFNVERPLSAEAFKSWNYFGNGDFPEKFCHFSGESSDGETCFDKPIMKANWKKAKEIFNL